MIEHYIIATRSIEALRNNPAWSNLQGLAARLFAEGTTKAYGRILLSGAAHFATWTAKEGRDLDAAALESFAHHLVTCACNGVGRYGRYLQMSGARKLVRYLDGTWREKAQRPPPPSPLLKRFATWLHVQRGLRASTVKVYLFQLRHFVAKYGGTPSAYTPGAIRSFVIDRAADGKRARARSSAIALRTFLRFCIASGLCGTDTLSSIPRVPQWQLVELPKTLSRETVERVIVTAKATSRTGARNQAILLLLARLGLRASDVANMRLSDIDWNAGRVRVEGKNRREAWLPLPQEVGDAILKYLEYPRPENACDALFLSARASSASPLQVDGLTTMVRSTLWQARVETKSHGSHLLRHSFASDMLRQGATLDVIGSVLRHADLRVTGIYAKVDTASLLEVAQPWPVEVAPC